MTMKIKLFILIMLLFSFNTTQAKTIVQLMDESVKQTEPFKFRLSNPKTDKWIADDKFAHFSNGALSALILRMITDSDDRTMMIESIAWTLWEIKDGYLPWEKYGFIGGDGFSYKDLAVSILGASAGVILYRVLKNHIEKEFPKCSYQKVILI